MIFESRAPLARILKTGGGVIAFRPGLDRAERGEPYGTFDTTSSDVEMAGFGTDEAAAVAAIKSSGAYLHGDIWIKEDRLDRQRGAKLGAARSSVVAGMNELQLRGVIAGSQVAVPQEGVEIEELRRIADACLSGDLKPGSVPEAKPQAETPVPPEVEDEPKPEGKPAKKKK